MNVQNEMKLSFLSNSVNEAFARTAVTSFFTQLDPTLDELTDIKTAVSEADYKLHCPCLPGHNWSNPDCGAGIGKQYGLHKGQGQRLRD